jgi:hypothetical protein
MDRHEEQQNRPVSNGQAAIPPAEGERRAQRGLVPQYKIAAEKILGLLTSGRLHQVGIADPRAETLDDIQTVRRQGALLILDAYQVKWSKPGETLIDSEFRSLLVNLVKGRRAVAHAAQERAEQGADPVDRVVAHLYTSKSASTARLRGKGLDGENLGAEGCTLHAFLEAVWQPAQRGVVQLLEQIDSRWHAYVRLLADRCGLPPEELLAMAPELRVELARELEEDELDPSDWQTRDRLKDLIDIRTKLQDLVSDRDVEWIWLSAAELVDKLGPEWSARWRPRLEHTFPTPGPYEPIAASVTALSGSLNRFDSGYIVLTGSPGSGKSTLLTRLLRADDRLAARYYAHIPSAETVSRGEASTFLHDLYLAIAGRQGQRLPAPRGEGIETLRTAFAEQLTALGRRAQDRGRTEIVLIDGLDHVSRDPRPHHPLLSELPAAEQIPDGVLLVLGTRGLGDLPLHVRRSVSRDRHVELAPLERAAVLRLCEQAGMPELGEQITELSSGHPLLVRTYLQLASELPADDREGALLELPPSHGDIWDFYETIWSQLGDQPEIVDLLALISRLRGPIRRSWLAATGTPAGDLVRLDSLSYLFDTRDRDRWRFFHSSFQEFLLRRTADRDGQPDPNLHRAVHQTLADRCRSSPSDAPERFDELHHLLEAGEGKRALARATPAFFRSQVDDLRPRDEVADDLRAAAAALAKHPDGMAAARLALSAHELRVRNYQFPEDQQFLDLLIALDLPEHAVAQLRAIDNGTVGHDRRKTAMRLAITLADAGHEGSAFRVFEEHEPLDWLGGPPSPLRASPAGPRSGLYAWSRAAARLRGASYVLEMVQRLRPPADLDRAETQRLEELPAELLWSAADELAALGDREQAAELRVGLVSCGEPGRSFIAMLDLALAMSLHDRDERARTLTMLEAAGLPHSDTVELAEALLELGHEQQARVLMAGLSVPELPERAGNEGSERRGWWELFRYWRLQATLSGRLDPAETVPESAKDYMRPVVVGARHLVVMADLEGRSRANNGVGITDVLAALRAMHAWWDSPRADRDDMWRPGRAVGLATRRAVVLAASQGPDQLGELLHYFSTRWESHPQALRFDGAELIGLLARHEHGRLSLRSALEKLEAMLRTDGASPENWVALGPAWLALDDRDAASRCLRQAVHLTLSPSSDKDIQLATWVKLIAPLLHGPDGPSLGDSLVEALKALDRFGSGGSPDYAAGALLNVLAARSPAEAWRLGERLLDAHLLRIDEVIRALLDAGADEPTPAWWVVVAELLVALGVERPGRMLEAATVANPDLADRWLNAVAERVAVEGRPTERRGWRNALLEAARAGGIQATEVHIEPGELEPSDEAPERRSSASDDDAPRQSVASLLVDAERDESPEHERADAVRKLSRRLDELDRAQLARLVAAGAGTESEATLRARLAATAAAEGDRDEAWTQGMAALRLSSSGDWSRHWAGGPMLDLIPALLQLDRPRARQAVFERFGELAGETDYFLGSVGQSLDDYVQVLELPPVELARTVLEVAGSLLRDIAPLPAPDGPRASQSAHQTTSDMQGVFEALVVHLLSLDQTLAWQAGQRALLELVGLQMALGAMRDALSAAPETTLRACAVLQARAGTLELDEAFVSQLEELTRAPRLDVRLASASCLEAFGLPVPPLPPRRELPGGLLLELPPRVADRRVVGALEQKLRFWRPQIEALAELADVDEDALHEHVLLLARTELEGLEDIDRIPNADSFLGWGYVKPSARAIRVALAKTAAELLDARLIGARDALRAADLHPPLDPELLEHRPGRRPAAVKTFVPRDQRNQLYGPDLSKVAAGAADRLARDHKGWKVLGEYSEVTLLNRAGHHELRLSGLVRPGDGQSTSPHYALGPLTISEYGRLRREGQVDCGIVRSLDLPAATPAGWLALHPRLAGSMGLTLEDASWLDWSFEGRPAVRSLWWRSGYFYWSPYSEEDEVGEGWLVLGSPEVLERLCAGGWELAYEVRTLRRGEDGDAQEVLVEGTRALMDAQV